MAQPGLSDATTTATGSKIAGDDVWDEEQLEKAMARLKEIHIQVGAFPEMVV